MGFGFVYYPGLMAAIVIPLIFGLASFGIKKTLDELDAIEAREAKERRLSTTT